mmetsp:Transcript_3711/g.3848  ORF Transcript_3711/g.3848 Transcript_3711/m.3848 type:complete len:169 (-) Transcript_3711:141-647(-)|eukprot:CAMPEP_0182416174 /NCGR_PEP_ID=MMETSP1167-20130531/338_1 /TAXON_ID=2988 /ORGANISM="Mallomonas Sp, Strain CCMP3275" /LENGTH=168 /DNA_ID=CAMNT_0024588685 /DNA_START=146 /DNA_END=652 /DNA_ORIENTATION=-
MIKIHFIGGKSIEGKVYSIDPVTHSIVIQNDSKFSIINPENIQQIEGEIPSVPSEDVPQSITNPQALQGLEKQEARSLHQAEKKISEMNNRVSPEVQALFDRLNFIYPCVWSGDSIMVVDQFRIDPPYTAANATKLADVGNEESFNRFIKVLEGENKKRNKLKAVSSG